MSRINNSAKSLISALGTQILLFIFNFVNRTVFIHTLGIQYLGLNGLFGNIILMLSLTELGFGTAIMYSLYKPLAENDRTQITLLMKFYKKVYRIIGLVITTLGLMLLPFLFHLIKDPPTFISQQKIYIIFTLYLMQSVSSYLFFAYKSTLLRANQKTYIINQVGYIFIFGSQLLQILTLYILKSYIIYVSIIIFSNIIQNIVIARIVDKKYSFINEKTKEKIARKVFNDIIKNCYALSLYKINGVLINIISGLIISKFVGLVMVGLYSNYLLFTNGIAQITNYFITSINPSVGNLNADASVGEDKKLLVFKVINMLTFMMHGTIVITFFSTINPLITIWLGEKYVLSQSVVFLLCVNIYFLGNSCASFTFRTAKGLFWQAKYIPLIGIIINIGVSLALVKPFAIIGVLIGTVSTSVLTYGILDPYIIYKYGFHHSIKTYYLKNLLYDIIILSCGGLVYCISNLLPLNGILRIFVTGIIAVSLSGLSFLIFFQSNEFKYLKLIVLSLLKKNNNIA